MSWRAASARDGEGMFGSTAFDFFRLFFFESMSLLSQQTSVQTQKPFLCTKEGKRGRTFCLVEMPAAENQGNQGSHSSARWVGVAREAVERAFILQRLRDNNWNVSRTAAALGIERTHLHRKLKILGIQRGDR